MTIDINSIINHNANINDSVIMDYFQYQYRNCDVYQKYVNLLGVKVNSIDDIPFLPIQFFKSKKIYSGLTDPETVFTSSGTTGTNTSKHYVASSTIYQQSYSAGFSYFFGDVSRYAILALLPSYLEREGSSLITMVQGLINNSHNPASGFFLRNHSELFETLLALKRHKTPTILIGVSFALLDFIDEYKMSFPELIVMETGGMKGQRKEITRQELHSIIRLGFGVNTVYSEYGMTELLSQAYSKGNGIYETPPWVKIIIRDPRNPLRKAPNNTSGGVNIIDLANIHSCSFIETQDLGILHSNNTFEIIGRFDESDIRGCNLMLES